MPRAPVELSLSAARRHWLRAQRLDAAAPFGAGPAAVRAAVEHLGYVQIDTIHVIERSHHHILFTRNDRYRPADLRKALEGERTAFENWTHSAAVLPIPQRSSIGAPSARARQRGQAYRGFG